MVKSQLSDVVIPDCTVYDIVLGDIHRGRDKIAMVDGITGVTYTYGDLRRMSEAVASGLARTGVKKGDVVLLMSQNNPQFAIVMFAVLRVGAVITTTNPDYTPYEIETQLKDSRTSYIYTTNNLTDKAKLAARRAGCVKKIISLGGGEGCIPLSQLLSDDGSAIPQNVAHNTRDETAFILYSSGTTGLPKGVMLTHRNFVSYLIIREHPETHNAFITASAAAAGKQHVMLGFLPFYHMFGLFAFLVAGLYNRYKIVTMPKFHLEPFLQLIEKHKVSLLNVVPPVVVAMVKNPLTLKYNLTSIESIGCGGAPLNSETETAFRKLLPNITMRQGYGMTEVMAVCGTLAKLEKPASVGVLMANTEAKIIDLSNGKELGADKPGEILIRGPQVMKGYLNNPEATRQTIDQEGWLHTGDVGYYDSSEHFYIVDRIKELIKVKGYQVAPAELEALLLTHPDVADVGVVGVTDEISGQVPRAYVVKKQHHTVTAQDLHKFVKEKLTKYKWLTGGIEFLDAIPKSPSGKILRRKLRELATQQKSKL